MFYLHYLAWSAVYFMVWFFFYLRKFFLKHFNYPRYPETFEFDKLSIFWRWLLVYFYSENNFLSNLPLTSKDVKKILYFRNFIKFNFFSMINFNKKFFIKKNFTICNYNEYKYLYAIFYQSAQKSYLLNYFAGPSNFFLKFILVKNYFFAGKYNLFFYNFFYKIYSNFLFYQLDSNAHSKKKLVLLDFFFFICLSLLKFNNKFYVVENHFRLNKIVFNKLTNNIKKPILRNRNYYSHDHKELLKYFNICKKLTNDILNNLYRRVWVNFIINLTGKNTYTVNLKNFLSNVVVNYDVKFINFFSSYWPVRFQNDTFTKFTDLNYNKNNLVLFLRKNKIFNKGRYSRNRQIYRTGVYMCLWINIIFVYFYIFSFYRFAFNFGFMWVGIGLFIISMVLGRASKYRFYNFKNFIGEVFYFFNWVGFLTTNFWQSFTNFFGKFFFKNESV